MIVQFYTKKLFNRRYWLGNIGIRQKIRPSQGLRNISNFYNLQTPNSSPSNVITNLNICQSPASGFPCTCPNNLEQSTNNRTDHPNNPHHPPLTSIPRASPIHISTPRSDSTAPPSTPDIPPLPTPPTYTPKCPLSSNPTALRIPSTKQSKMNCQQSPPTPPRKPLPSD